MEEVKSIGVIREELQAAASEQLPDFITAYEKDGRTSVQKLVAQAENRVKKLKAERQRIWELGSFEREYGAFGYVCGVDEAGRGPLAGPVVAGAVILPGGCDILYINDSKKLSEKKREELYDVILKQAVAVGVGMASPRRIDEVNILNATYEAMQEAIQKLSQAPDILLNDAVTIPKVTIKQVPIIKGDASSLSIAAASVIAKVTRDRMMKMYDTLYPDYGFAKHKGYGCEAHIEAIKKKGASPIHRKSFLKNFIVKEHC